MADAKLIRPVCALWQAARSRYAVTGGIHGSTMFKELIVRQTAAELISLELLQTAKEARQYLRVAGRDNFDFDEVTRLIARSPMLVFAYLNNQAQAASWGSITEFFEKYIPAQLAPESGELFGLLPAEDRSRLEQGVIADMCRHGLISLIHLFYLIRSRKPDIVLQALASEIRPDIQNMLGERYQIKRALLFTDRLSTVVARSFLELARRIKQHAIQTLGYDGLLRFFQGIIDDFTIDDLLEQGRGVRGIHVLLLRYHLSACAEIAISLAEGIRGSLPEDLAEALSPYEAYTCALFHDLGLSLLMKFQPDLHMAIWKRLGERFEAGVDGGRERASGDTYWRLEREEFRRFQKAFLVRRLGELRIPALTRHASFFKDLPEGLPQELSGRLEALVQKLGRKEPAQAGPRPLPEEWGELLADIHLWHSAGGAGAGAGLWSRVFADLFRSVNLPETLTPIRNNGELASFALESYCRRGLGEGFTLLRYRSFVEKFHDWEAKDFDSAMVPFIRLCNDLTRRIAGRDYSHPVVFTNALDGEPVFPELELSWLSRKLGLADAKIAQLCDEAVDSYLKRHEQDRVPVGLDSIRQCPLFRPDQQVRDQECRITLLFQQSPRFGRGMRPFFELEEKLKLVLVSPDASPELFFRTLEIELQNVLGVEQVRCVPNIRGRDTDFYKRELYLFKRKMDSGRECFVEVFRHTIASVYIIDRQEDRARHPDVRRFLSLLCDYLLLSYDQEMSVLLRSHGDLSRLDIAREICALYRLEDTLNYQLVRLKALVMNKLLEDEYEKESEPRKIFRVHFAVLHALRDRNAMDVYPTDDFRYWEDRCRREGLPDMDYDAYLAELRAGLSAFADLVDQRLVEEGSSEKLLFLRLQFRGREIPVLLRRLFSPQKEEGVHFLLLLFGFFDQDRCAQLLEEVLPHQDLSAMSEFSDMRRTIPTQQLLELLSREDIRTGLGGLPRASLAQRGELEEMLEVAGGEARLVRSRLPREMQERLDEWLAYADRFVRQSAAWRRQEAMPGAAEAEAFERFSAQMREMRDGLRVGAPQLMRILDAVAGERRSRLDASLPLLSLELGGEIRLMDAAQFAALSGSLRAKTGNADLSERRLGDMLHGLESAWFVGHAKHLERAFREFLMLHEKNLQDLSPPGGARTPFGTTLFQYIGEMPHNTARVSTLAVECFLPCDTEPGSQLPGIGEDYSLFYKEHFLPLAYIAHRIVTRKGRDDRYSMQVYFRDTGPANSIQRPVPPEMLKDRFLSRTGVSVIFFFPCHCRMRPAASIEISC